MATKRKPKHAAHDGPKRARRYGRVSTAEQNEPGAVSIPDQDTTTAGHCARRGWTDGGFTHDEETGTDTDRTRWQELMADCRRGEVDVIICAKLDRFSRRTLAGLQQIAELEAMGVDVVLCDIDLDTSTPGGKAMRSMLLVFAELERDTIIDRMAKGQYGKARNGGWPSSKNGAPFGLTVEGTKREARLVLDEAESATIRKAAELLLDEGRELSEVCATLNGLGMLTRTGVRWWTEKLRQMLADPARKGVVTWGKPKRSSGAYGAPTPIPGVPGVLTPERWQAVQDALARRRSFDLGESRIYPLSGRMTSPCGNLYTGATRNDTVPPRSQYKCRGVRWREEPDWQPCGCTRLRANEIEARVWAEVVQLLTDPERLRALAADYLGLAGADSTSQATEVGSLDRQIRQLRERMSSQVAGFIRAGTDPAIVAGAVAQLEEEATALENRRDDIARWIAEGQEARHRMDSLDRLAQSAAGRLDGMSLSGQREVLGLLDVRVQVLDQSRAPGLKITGTVCDAMLPGNPDQEGPAPAAGSGGPPPADAAT